MSRITRKPSKIIPIALIDPKIKFDKLFTTVIGSSAAKTFILVPMVIAKLAPNT